MIIHEKRRNTIKCKNDLTFLLTKGLFCTSTIVVISESLMKKGKFITLLITIFLAIAGIATLEAALIILAYTPAYQAPLKLPLVFPLFFLPVAGFLMVSLYYLWYSKQRQNDLLLEEAVFNFNK